MRALLTLVGHDLRQHLRDRSMLLFAVVIPLSLAFVFSLAFSGIEDVALDPVTVAVSAAEEDEAAQAVVATLEGLPEQGVEADVRRVPLAQQDEVAAQVEDGTAGVGVVLPEGFGVALSAGDGTAGVTVRLGPDAGLSGDVVASLVASTVARMDADAAALALAAGSGEGAGLTGAQVDALAAELAGSRPEVERTGARVSGESLSLSSGIVAGQAGMFLFFTVGFAVLTLLTEREWGTLGRVRTMPLPRWMVPVSKALVALLLGVTSTTVILLAGAFLLDGVSFGSWPVVLLLVVAVVAAATSVMFIILRVAATSEQASLAMSVIALTLGVSGGSFFTVPTEGWVGRLLTVNPVAALIRGLGITSGGGGAAALAPVLLTLLAFTAGALLVARLLPARRDAL
ncbi:ABC transporter permease [Ornithinimicrobium sp. LYQ92]|uniref:ABC transporter permease n=1 Tax=Serinicoccus sp. LYQ92 TaxID=3378798 RepID=UPI0038546C25